MPQLHWYTEPDPSVEILSSEERMRTEVKTLPSFSSFAINITFSNPSNSSIFSFPFAAPPHRSPHPPASCHPSFFHPSLLLSLTPICFSPLLLLAIPLSLSARPTPCLLFHLLPLFSRPFPLRPYHLTLMRVFNHLYGGRERHEILCLQEDERWAERGRERETSNILIYTQEKKKIRNVQSSSRTLFMTKYALTLHLQREKMQPTK